MKSLIHLVSGSLVISLLGLCVASAGETGAAPVTVTPAASRNGGKAVLDELRASGHRLVLAPEAAKDGKCELYMAAADGSQPVNITNTADKDERLPRVNPKTGRIAFLTAGKLAFMDADGKNREETEVDLAGDKDWNPDGTKMVLAGEREKFGFRIYDPKSKQVQTLGKDKNGFLDMDWSPDGKLFTFATRKEMGFRYTVLTMNADGTKIRPFASQVGDYPYCHPSWHPSEMRIAWNSRQGLLVADYEPSDGKAKNAKSVVSFKDVGWEDPSPRWSPDGAYIAWLRDAKARRLCVVRVADSAWAELDLPKEWKFEAWEYDWVPRESDMKAAGQARPSEGAAKEGQAKSDGSKAGN